MKERTITFIVTKDCQLRCRYCYLVAKNSGENMTLGTGKSIVDFILNEPRIQKEDRVVLDFIGGEPLLQVDLIDKIIDYWRQETKRINHKWKDNYGIRITTNGLLFSSEAVKNFVRKNLKNLFISISIDGNKTKHDQNRVFPNGQGSFDIVYKNVTEWIKQFPEAETKSTISHDDLKDVFESLKFLIELGIKKIDVNPVVENVWKPGDAEILESELIKLADYIIDSGLWQNLDISAFYENIGLPLGEDEILNPCGTMSLSIDSNGDIYTCIRFAKYSLRTKIARPIGNINHGINWNWVRPMALLQNRALVSEKCLTCEIASGCRWCPAENYDSSETCSVFQRSTNFCDLQRARVHAKNYYWNRIFNMTR